MKLIDVINNELTLFNGKLLLDLLIKKSNSNSLLNIEPSITFSPMIKFSKPKLYDLEKELYLIRFRTQMSEKCNDFDSKDIIIETKVDFIIKYDEISSKKDFFESLFIKADESASKHFFNYINEFELKIKPFDEKYYLMSKKCNYGILKLNTKYRNFPILDHEHFFNSKLE